MIMIAMTIAVAAPAAPGAPARASTSGRPRTAWPVPPRATTALAFKGTWYAVDAHHSVHESLTLRGPFSGGPALCRLLKAGVPPDQPDAFGYTALVRRAAFTRGLC